MEITERSYHELDYARVFYAVIILLAHCRLFNNTLYFGNSIQWFNRYLANTVVPYFFTITGFFCAKRISARGVEDTTQVSKVISRLGYIIPTNSDLQHGCYFFRGIKS